MVGSEFGIHTINSWTQIRFFLPTVQIAGAVVMAWGMFSWHTLHHLMPSKHHLKATANLSFGADYVHPFMATIYPSHNDNWAAVVSIVAHRRQFMPPNLAATNMLTYC